MTADDLMAKKTTRLSQIEKQSDSARRLVEYFVIVSSVMRTEKDSSGDSSGFSEWKTESYDEEDNDNVFRDFKFRPAVTARYPLTDHSDNPLHENVTFFCHPTGGINLRTDPFLPKVHFFVATGGTGKQIYGTCLTLWEPRTLRVKSKDSDEEEDREVFLPKCLVILSQYPYLAAFREFLTQLHHLTKNGEMKLPVERYIVNFCAEIPAPPPGSFEVQTTMLDSVIKIWSPPHNMPITWVSIPFGHTFECLDIDNIILVWHCLALERQVLITSTQLSLLTQTTEVFLSLLFPMRWSHAYIPVLPTFLIPMLSAPMPFLCGINKTNLADALYDLSRECVLVDLDKNTVTLGPDTPPLPPLPPFQEATLRAQLEENAGMVFREVRSLTKNDDFSESGTRLPSHVKMMADNMWESRLCLLDEAFHLLFTPEETRKNLLNGNDASGMEIADRDITNPLAMMMSHTVDKSAGRKQSPWDAVQEAFLDTFVYLLRNYRKYLVFPSKHNEGSYGGAGFSSKEFISMQRYDMREFLEQLIGTQMFDSFITKRLYGSGEADVAFFDEAVDKFLKTAGLFADVDLSGRLLDASGFKAANADKRVKALPGTKKDTRRPLIKNAMKVFPKVNENPLLQSAKVHRMLKTIVPPEPTGEGLPENIAELLGSIVVHDDDEASVHSSTSGGTRGSSLSSPARFDRIQKEKNRKFIYPEFPSSFNEQLFCEPRPLSAAVIAEFDRQRKDAAQFRRKGENASHDKETKGPIRRANATVDPIVPPSPEAATFTVFFMAFSALVGRELMQIAHDAEAPEKTILSTYVPTRSGHQPPESDIESVDDISTQDDPIDEAEKADIQEMKAVRPMGGMFGDDEDLSESDTKVVTRELENVDLASNPSVDNLDEPAPAINGDSQENETPSNGNESSSQAEAPKDDATATTAKSEESQPRKRFHDKLSDLQIEEAKATGRAQLGLAFEMLTMMRKRALRADPDAYQSLIDACGRVGDTKRATELLGRMHEDGIVADGTVYACLVSAFSAESAWRDKSKQQEELPEWANSTAVEMDWNKFQKRTFLDRLVGQVVDLDDDDEDDPSNENMTTYQKLRKRVFRVTQKDVTITKAEDKMEFFVTESVERQIALGENLLEIVFPDISVDTENEVCPRCNFLLSDDDVVEGWTPGDSNDYTTSCPNCTQRFVPHFCVQSSSPSFMGSKGPASPLLCERLSPWVLQKEIRSVMNDVEGIDGLLDPAWREREYKNAVFWWNLVLSCMRYRLPFTFLLQGSFEQNLIAPMPEDES